jgi:hypothetical protein
MHGEQRVKSYLTTLQSVNIYRWSEMGSAKDLPLTGKWGGGGVGVKKKNSENLPQHSFPYMVSLL